MNTGGNKYIAFFVGSEKSAIGGMETHAKYFYNHFGNMFNRRALYDFQKS